MGKTEEIDAEEDEDELFKKIVEFAETEAGKVHTSCTDRDKLQKLGLWDMVYDAGDMRR